jgi:N-acetylglucosamine-6-phosphate deacetylase
MISAITDAVIFDGEKLISDHIVVIKNSKILAIAAKDTPLIKIDHYISCPDSYIAPGFIDLQVNGGGGVMFNSDPSVEAIECMSIAHRKYGTTGFLPTLITTDFDMMQRAIKAVDQAIKKGIPGVLGIHLEGPFLSIEKKGAHDASKFCQIDGPALNIVSSLTVGKTILTLAPELTEINVIQKLKKLGIIVCAGHSNADYTTIVKAIKAGVKGFTHLYNAMTPLQSREPGMVGAAISNDDTWFGIIADGFHMHPAAFKVAIQAKKQGGAILVTDAMSTVGSSHNSFELNGETIYARDGRCENAAGSLAGSDLDMNSAIKNAKNFANITWQEAIRMASLYPAKALSLDNELGRILPGYTANLVQLDQDLSVVSSWTNGKHSRSSNQSIN